MEREEGRGKKKKNPPEFIIKWDLLNVKQKPSAISRGPGGASSRVSEGPPTGLAALLTGATSGRLGAS